MSDAPKPSLERTIVLVGIMGAGKSAIGRRLAQSLGLSFVDADDEIETAAGCTIAEIFERYGEAEFRQGEERVIARLLQGPRRVVATGGGAFMSAKTRAAIRVAGVSIWLRADLATLMKRVRRRQNRPLLKQGDPEGTMARLIEERYPIYGEADIVIDSSDGPHAQVVEAVVDALRGRTALGGEAERR